MKNIIALKNIHEFYQKHPNAKTSLENWIAITKHANWEKPSDVVADFSDADPVRNNRVVFNIAHNRYWLVVQISYIRKWVFIKFIDTHAEYNKVMRIQWININCNKYWI